MRRKIYYLIWILLSAFFLALGAPKFLVDLRREKFPAPSPTSTIDRRIGPLLHMSEPSARLTEAFAQLPVDCRALLVFPAHVSEWEYFRCAVAYLTWPRKIDIARVRSGESFTGPLDEQTATFFCGLPVPANANSTPIVIAPNLVLVPPVTHR